MRVFLSYEIDVVAFSTGLLYMMTKCIHCNFLTHTNFPFTPHCRIITAAFRQRRKMMRQSLKSKLLISCMRCVEEPFCANVDYSICILLRNMHPFTKPSPHTTYTHHIHTQVC